MKLIIWKLKSLRNALLYNIKRYKHKEFYHLFIAGKKRNSGMKMENYLWNTRKKYRMSISYVRNMT